MKSLFAAAALLMALPAQAAPDIGTNLRFLYWNDGIELLLAVTNRTPRPVCLHPVVLQSARFFTAAGEKVVAGVDPHADPSQRGDSVVPADGKPHEYDAPVSLAAFPKGSWDVNHISRVRYAVSIQDCTTHRTIARRHFDQPFTTTPVP